MKRIIFKLLIPFLGLSLQVDASNISGNIDAYQMGTWAMTQHNTICHIIYPAIEANKVKVLNMSKKEALEILSQRVPVFLQFDPNDPTSGKDTFYSMPLSNRFESFTLEPDGIRVKINSLLKDVKISPDLKSLMNPEEKVYFDLFKVNNVVEYRAIPSTSFNLVLNLNKKLYKESSKPASITYKNDSLTSKLSLSDKKRRGNLELYAFIQTDTSDPTIGHDTFMVITYNDNISDSLKYLGVNFVMKSIGKTLKLEAISCTFETYSYNSKEYYLHPYGYISYELCTSLSATEKKLLEYCIWYTMNGRLKYNDINLKSYLKEFDLQPLTANRGLAREMQINRK